ncbi:aquaporin-like protein [Xylariaceae sp. FL0594]|nr:aquaporin-like protein [Xylariaceae sp. FL0594]
MATRAPRPMVMITYGLHRGHNLARAVTLPALTTTTTPTTVTIIPTRVGSPGTEEPISTHVRERDGRHHGPGESYNRDYDQDRHPGANPSTQRHPHHDQQHALAPDQAPNWGQVTDQETAGTPWARWMGSNTKNHFVATMGEFIGTTLFLLFAFAGAQVASLRPVSRGFSLLAQLYISLAFSISLMINVWIFFRISGGHFNPAVTFAMLLLRAISWRRAVCYIVAQLAGAMLASVIVRFLFPMPFGVLTLLSAGTSIVQGLFIEAIMTAELILAILMLAKEKHRATFLAPLGIGLALFIAEMAAVPFTGGSLNPARSFGPSVVARRFSGIHWIYWVGPALGAVFAVLFYKLLKILKYEMANPGADADEVIDPAFDPNKRQLLPSTRNTAGARV